MILRNLLYFSTFAQEQGKTLLGRIIAAVTPSQEGALLQSGALSSWSFFY